MFPSRKDVLIKMLSEAYLRMARALEVMDDIVPQHVLTNAPNVAVELRNDLKFGVETVLSLYGKAHSLSLSSPWLLSDEIKVPSSLDPSESFDSNSASISSESAASSNVATGRSPFSGS